VQQKVLNSSQNFLKQHTLTDDFTITRIVGLYFLGFYIFIPYCSSLNIDKKQEIKLPY